MHRIARKVLISLAAAGLIIAGGLFIWVERGRADAVRMAASGHWADAMPLLKRFLWLHPNDAPTRLLLAQCLTADPRIDPNESARHAITELGRIRDDSPIASEARSRAGRLTFLVLHRPTEAERLFRRAVELDPDNIDAHLMLWKLLAMTERFPLSAPSFWNVYDRSPASERPVLLRDWYLCEFGPGSAHAMFDLQMGFLGEEEKPSAVTQLTRLQGFRDAEPESPLSHAALATLLFRERHLREAVEVLRDASRIETAATDSDFLSAQIEICVEQGRFEEAVGALDRWPEPRSGYRFWKWCGVIADEFHRDNDAALAAYSLAIDDWPGRTDWQLQSRMVHCLVRAGRREEAERLRESAKRTELLMESAVHQRLRKLLLNPSRSDAARELADFYRSLGRVREAGCWTDLAS